MEDTVGRNCFVSLKRLTQTEIERYTKPSLKLKFTINKRNKHDRQHKKLANHQLKDVSRVDYSLFDEYKRNRTGYLKRKKKEKNVPRGIRVHSENYRYPQALSPDCGFASKLDSSPSFLGLPLDRSPTHSFAEPSPRKFRLKKAEKRKTLAIQSDSDSCDDSDSSKGTEQGEIKSTDMAMLETDNEFHKRISNKFPYLHSEHSKICSSDKRNIEKKLSHADNSSSLPELKMMTDHGKFDVVSRIMQEMDSSKKNRIVLTHQSNITTQNSSTIKEEEKINMVSSIEKNPSSFAYSIQKLKKSNPASDKCLNNRNSNIIKTKQKCKWCGTLFDTNNQEETVCAICIDISKNRIPNCNSVSSQVIGKGRGQTKKIGKTFNMKFAPNKNKTFGKLLKNISPGEKKRLLFKDKNAHTSSHMKLDIGALLKSKNSGLEAYNTSNITRISPNCVKVSKISNPEKTSQLSKVANTADLSNSIGFKGNADKDMPKQCKENAKNEVVKHSYEMKNIDKGLFLMTFPEPDKELDLDVALMDKILDSAPIQSEQLKVSKPQKIAQHDSSELASLTQPNNVNPYGLLPSAPGMVVANYSSLLGSGNFYLTDVYYQNSSSYPQGKSVMNSNANNSLQQLGPNENLASINFPNVPPDVTPNNFNLPLSSMAPIDGANYVSDDASNARFFNKNMQVPIVATKNACVDSSLGSHCRSSETSFNPNCDFLDHHVTSVSSTPYEDSILQKSLTVGSKSVENVKSEFQNFSSCSFSSSVISGEENENQMFSNISLTSPNDKQTNLSMLLKGNDSNINGNLSDKVNYEGPPTNATAPETHKVILSKVISSALQEIDAFAILGILDLDINSEQQLDVLIENEKASIEKINSTITSDSTSTAVKTSSMIPCFQQAKQLLKL